jgi:NAD(P)-dependent dehydrogenase (short-subunit alcohol dehydrogenase family)
LADGASAAFVRTDVCDEASVAAAVDATRRFFGRLDFAANCAGAGGDMAPLDRTDQPCGTT